jgi:hypothetical protein
LFERIQRNSGDIEAAFGRDDRTTAFGLIEENKQLNSELRQYPAEWRPMHAELRAAKEAYEPAEAEFRPLQEEFVRLRDAFDDADAEYQATQRNFDATTPEFERAKAVRDAAQAEQKELAKAYREAKAEAERAEQAFQRHLAKVKADQDRRKDDKLYLARRAGIPPEYEDDVWISIQGEIVNFYFGGAGEPNGPGHGHYAMNIHTGEVTYARNPDEKHGAHNFKDYEEQVPARPLAEKGNWYTKYRTDDETIHLMVDKEGNPTTEYPHVHVIHDEKNNQIRVVASYAKDRHSDTMTLSGDASGNDVNAAVEEMRRRL